MATVTNTTRAPWTINVREGDEIVLRTIQPGQTADMDPVDTDAFKGAVEAGFLRVETGTKPAARKADDKS